MKTLESDEEMAEQLQEILISDAMGNEKIEISYFEEKKELTLDGIKHAQDIATKIIWLLNAWSYELPDTLDATNIHEHIKMAKAQLDGARRNFEKARWASASTNMEFNEWLIKNGHSDLVLG